MSKRRYPTEAAASSAAFRMWRFYADVNIEDLRPYWCPYHHCWHIGHKSKFLAGQAGRLRRGEVIR
jgi:hypothetical protein